MRAFAPGTTPVEASGKIRIIACRADSTLSMRPNNRVGIALAVHGVLADNAPQLTSKGAA
jgi:hypothetical protein